MENENRVLEKIISFAACDEDIRLVIQNGSRVNPVNKPDKYSDYDIIYASRNFSRYVTDKSWISFFGDLLILQLNIVSKFGTEYPIFLMQFESGLRIDLSFLPVEKASYTFVDSLTKILLDKDNLYRNLPAASELSYLTGIPDEEDYYRTLNEFWWSIISVAKGIARGELCYSKYFFECIARECFLKIVAWHISSRNGWAVNTGKFGKFIHRYADRDLWKRIDATYAGNDDAEFFQSVYLACEIVLEAEEDLSGTLGYRKVKERGGEIIGFIRKIESGSL